MKNSRLLFFLFLIIVFLAGLYWIFYSNVSRCSVETLKDKHEIAKKDHENKEKKDDTNNCPDMLIQKGNILLLYNSKKPKDETNPIPFYNLDEYIYYLDAQRKLGNNCPVLYLKQETNTQGKDVYRIRPSPFDLQGGLPATTNEYKKYVPPSPIMTDINSMSLSAQQPLNSDAIQIKDASRENPPYNQADYASFDPQGLYIGKFTNLDEIHESTKNAQFSDNPMDPNWGGVEYTQSMIDIGKYEENNITKPMLFQPRTAFIPIDTGNGKPQPLDVI
uniref:Uncharacterized protein n=1 Tax=viral metagenome TaxID=1070528 RepID=A0A6C0JEL4_9ZZZZ